MTERGVKEGGREGRGERDCVCVCSEEGGGGGGVRVYFKNGSHTFSYGNNVHPALFVTHLRHVM